MSKNNEERIAKVSELELVANNPANDAITRNIASDRIINMRLLIQSQQGSSRTRRNKAVQRAIRQSSVDHDNKFRQSLLDHLALSMHAAFDLNDSRKPC